MMEMRCPACTADLLGEHRAGCAWYAERVLEVIAGAIEDDVMCAPRRPPDEMAD
jgi:hypothetical protein